MQTRRLVASLVFLSAGVAFAGVRASVQQATPGPTEGRLLVDGLLKPHGIKVGPDGMLYVAEAGSGGTTRTKGPLGNDVLAGNTGRISRIDPATGERTTVVDGIPSARVEQGLEAEGVADIGFLDGALYFVRSHNPALPDSPNGIYKVKRDGTFTLFANVGEFTAANPVADVKNGSRAHVAPSLLSMTVRGRSFYVVDVYDAQVLQVTDAGAVSRIAEFPSNPRPAGIASVESGALYVAAQGHFPYLADDGRVFQVGFPTGNLTQIANGVSSLTGLAIGPGRQLYGESLGEPAFPGWMPGTGRIVKVNGDATLSTIVSGFSFGTALTFIGDTAYVLSENPNAPGAGEVWAIPSFSSIEPVPASTATPLDTSEVAPGGAADRSVGAITAPSTGTGGQAARSRSGSHSMLLMLGIAGAVGVSAGARLRWKADGRSPRTRLKQRRGFGPGG